MKKNISINISGIIFHIEEDGFDMLKNYLDSINKYFSTYDESAEIIADIENRIAEIFLAKLKDGRQVIALEDIQSLMATMGSIEDFQAMENGNRPEEEKEETIFEPKGPRRLYRDNKRKLIGGVAAGISHYFGIDPLWIRLVLIIMFFNIIFKFSITGTLFVAYIIGWIIIPGSDDLKEDEKLKKLYRDSEGRVIGGVSAGLARYFGVDVTLVRFLFVVTTFLFFTGLITYLILWVITPEAKTITDRMQMEGKKITLGNIENSIKKSLNVEGKEESAITKILLFPFRLLAAIIDGLAKLLGPLFRFMAEGVRIFFGVILLLLAMSAVLSILVLFGVSLGVFTDPEPFIVLGDFPVLLLKSGITSGVLLGLFLVTVVPFLALMFGALAILARRPVVKSSFMFILLGVWFVGILISAISVPDLVFNYQEEAEKEIKQVLVLPTEVFELRAESRGKWDEVRGVEMVLRGHSDSSLLLVKRQFSRGRTFDDAEKNAKGIVYQPELQGNTYVFAPTYELAEDMPFRFQSLRMTLYIPYGQEFLLDGSLRPMLRNTMYRHGYSRKELNANHTWKFEEAGLICVTCDSTGVQRKSISPRSASTPRPGSAQAIDVEDFKKVMIKGRYKVFISKGSENKVDVNGTDSQIRNARFSTNNGQLVLTERTNWNWFSWNLDSNKPAEIYIESPAFEKIVANGAIQMNLEDLDFHLLELELRGASEGKIKVKGEELKIKLTGASSLNMQGDLNRLVLKSSGASDVKATGLRVLEAEIDASGASDIRLQVEERLKVIASGASDIRYQGDPKIDSKTSGAASVKKIK